MCRAVVGLFDWWGKIFVTSDKKNDGTTTRSPISHAHSLSVFYGRDIISFIAVRAVCRNVFLLALSDVFFIGVRLGVQFQRFGRKLTHRSKLF